ncbi:DUF4034 domain-containing protein [Fodinicola acaciae]|uniref:DUF4034 domain-containing protein n=1 Tax=Fodinicola acaciae TaxID=2681555 RepID=UPI0013D1D34D|nr:DUF4034 domain-containing protein [Fodinicola acaciae]
MIVDDHNGRDDVRLRPALDAVAAGQWQVARESMVPTRTDFDRRSYVSGVLAEAVVGVRQRELRRRRLTPGEQIDTTYAWPDVWVAAEPDNPDAHLVRARSLLIRAWEVGRTGWAEGINERSLPEFVRLTELAAIEADEAARLLPSDPNPWAFRILLSIPLSAERPAMEEAWQEVIARDPGHRMAHDVKFLYLCERWLGSHEAMYHFARTAAATAADGSPLHILPICANAEWSARRPRGGQTPEQRWAGAEFNADLDNALDRWFRVAQTRHGMWHEDANTLAYGLWRAGRHAEAKPVFAAIGPYATASPWAGTVRGRRLSFRMARRAAMRGGLLRT